MTALERARILLFRASECGSSMIRSDYLYRVRDELNIASFPHWADLAESAAGRIGGDGADMRELLFDVEREISRRQHAPMTDRHPDAFEARVLTLLRRIGGDGADMERLLFDVEREISRRQHALPEAKESLAPKTPLDEIDLSTVESPTLRRLIEEVRLGVPSAFGGFDRTYNRHNR